jgi:hypothetical protein
MVKRALLAGVVCVGLPPTPLRAQAFVGPEFQVNTTYTADAQRDPSVAKDAHGNFVVVWWSFADGVVGRRFTAAGVPRGSDFVVRSYTAGYPSFPAVASSADGSFVVVWHSNGPDGNGYGIFGQRFDASGAPAGGEFVVNTYTTGPQRDPVVSADADGNFVVVWHGVSQFGDGDNVVGRRFDASGGSLGGEFQVATYAFPLAFASQYAPAVDSDADGNFVVVWQTRVTIIAPAVTHISGQSFDAGGNRLGSEFIAEEFTNGGRGSPDVALDGAGNFLVVWTNSFVSFPFGSSFVKGRRFDSTGTPLSGEFDVGTNGSGQGNPATDADAFGNFAVTWTSRGVEGESFFTGVYGQRLDASGGFVGGEFRVNAYTTGNQLASAVAVGPDEDFVVVWQSSQGGDDNVFGRLFGDLIFRNGFD